MGPECLLQISCLDNYLAYKTNRMTMCVCVCVSCSVVSDSLRPMDCSLSGSSVCGTLQTSILEWVAIPFSRGSSQPRDQIWVSHIAARFITIWATREAPGNPGTPLKCGPQSQRDASRGYSLLLHKQEISSPLNLTSCLSLSPAQGEPSSLSLYLLTQSVKQSTHSFKEKWIKWFLNTHLSDQWKFITCQAS